MAIVMKPEDQPLVEQAAEILRQRISPAQLNRASTTNGQHLSLWLSELVTELPADAQTLADLLYKCICRHVGDDKLDWLVEPAALAKFRKPQGRPLDAGRNVGDENRTATARDREYEANQKKLAAQKANASGYASARKCAELFVIEGRLGETIEFRNELLSYVAKQQMSGADGQAVYKEVERRATERYHQHRRRLEGTSR